MIRSVALLSLLLASPAFASSQAKLTDTICPYAKKSIPDGYTAECWSMAWTDEDVDYQTTVAAFEPDDLTADAAPMIYIPGGPGDAPVNKDGDITSILTLFPNRTVVTLNPRGVKGTVPRPVCTFPDDFWQDDLEPERETQIATGCRDAVKLDMIKLDSPHLAQDINRIVSALGFEHAGVFGVSYGTESALHLLAQRPDWLDFVILDSASLPGALGTMERLKARDRFLGVINRLCFIEKGCDSKVTDNYATLMEWTQQFDDNPISVNLGPNDMPWSLDGQDMLDFIASMASYPDGAGYGPVFIDAMAALPDQTTAWVDTEMEAGFEYAQNNFALLFSAFSDSVERDLPTPVAGDTTYPFKVDDYSEFARLFRLWNKSNRTEARFVDQNTKSVAAGIPVLILSGGVDSLTPLEWALELDQRFDGLTHFVFPDLGHAVAFGKDSDVNDRDVAAQLNCGPDVVRAFVDQKSYGRCERFLRKAGHD